MAINPATDAPEAILRFWRLIELLTPATFPKVDASSRFSPVYNIHPQDGMPWEASHVHARKKCLQTNLRLATTKRNMEWAYGLYVGLVNVSKVRDSIEQWLETPVDNVILDERPPQGTSIVGFQVNGDGQVISESLVFSTFSWAYGELHAGQGRGSVDEAAARLTDENFSQVEEEVTQRFEAELAGCLLDEPKLKAFLDWLTQRLSIPNEVLEKPSCRVQCVLRPCQPAGGGRRETNPSLTTALKMLNSLYSGDLHHVEQAVQEKQYGQALSAYLGQARPSKTDLRADHAAAWRLLNPLHYPQGRWPGKGRFPLVFSQQVAVNQAFRQFPPSQNRASGLMAVNGPPGTGKTTLLKDIVAGVIVERAKVLAQFSTPGQAFGKVKTAWKNRGGEQFYAELDERLWDFGIVVTSSNNGAVENVTMEFPKSGDVDAEWGKRSSPFTEIATILLGGQPAQAKATQAGTVDSNKANGPASEGDSEAEVTPDTGEPIQTGSGAEKNRAWTLMAACLGKSKNRKAFLDTFWGTEGQENPGHARVHEMLTQAIQGNPLEGVLSWQDAVEAFEAALAREAECRDARWTLYQYAEQVGTLGQRFRAQREQLETLEVNVTSLAERAGAAQRVFAAAEARYLAARAQVSTQRKKALKNATEREKALDRRQRLAKEAKAEAESMLAAHKAKAPSGLLRLFSQHIYALSSVTQWNVTYEALTKDIAENISLVHESLRDSLAASQEVARCQEALSEASINAAVGDAYHVHREARARWKTVDYELKQARASASKLKEQVRNTEGRLRQATEAIEAYRQKHGEKCAVLPEDLAREPSYKEILSPWADPVWEEARVAVFLAALNLHDAFIVAAGEPMLNNLRSAAKVVEGRAPLNLRQGLAETLWASLFLMVPLVSTTFASFPRQFKHLGVESLGWLLVDEAGQAPPQYAAGALWRSRRALVVGDPLQLTPVVTVPDQLQAALAKYCNVSDEWLPGFTSAQALADQASAYGSMIGNSWVGAPLLVHRRCENPMFDISNAVAYQKAMVHGKPPTESCVPSSGWLDVPAREAVGHWIPAEGKAIEQLIAVLGECGVPPSEIFLISPFRSVVERLHEIADRPGNAGLKAGTIHTVQGKESRVVILVLGGDPARAGAKQWAAQSPNLVNVAVSRAKHRLYIVGDRELWKEFSFFKDCADAKGLKHYPADAFVATS